VNVGMEGVDIGTGEAVGVCALEGLTIIRHETAKTTTRSNEKTLRVLPMLNLRAELEIKDFS